MSAPSNEDVAAAVVFALIIGLLFRSFLALLIALAIAPLIKRVFR